MIRFNEAMPHTKGYTMSKQFDTAAVASINAIARADKAADAVTAKHLPALRAACVGWSRDEVKAAILEPYAKGRGITLNTTKAGVLRWPSDVDGVDAAKKGCNRLISAIMGDSKNEREVLEVPATIQKLADALAKACSEYEEARRLANTALSAALSNLK